MSSELQSEERRFTLTSVSAAISLLLVTIGVLVVAGWIIDIPLLKSIYRGWVTMKVNTAVGFVLAGASLWCLRNERASPRVRRAGQVCAGFLTLIALLTLLQHLFGVDFGIDQLLMRQQPTAVDTVEPGRMSAMTALGFMLTGAALLALDWKNRYGHRPALVLALIAGVIGLLAIAGYLYGVRTLYAFWPFSSMALHTASLFVVISIGILCARVDRGPLAILTADGVGSTMARRLLPLAIVAPFAIGWMLAQAERQGPHGFEFSLALFAASTAILFAFLIWITAVSLNSGHAEQLKTEQSLLASESRLRTVLDSALSAVVVIDSTGRITDWNSRAEEMFGWTRDQSIGRELAERIIPPRYREAHRRGLERFLATGEGPALNRVIELTALRRDATEFPVELFIASMDAGDAFAFCGFVTDISERKRAQQALTAERTLLRTLIDALPDVVFTKDLAGRFSMCNAAAMKHHGISREAELLGKSVFDLYPRDLAEIYHADDMEAVAGRPVLYSEEPGLDAAGQRRWFLTTKMPLYDQDGRITGIVGISRDITERKEAEEHIRRLNTELEQRVAERTAELHARNRELETFSYTVSHDLKAPLRGIDGYSRLLLEDYTGKLDDEGRRFLENIRSATAHMQQLIDDLLAYSRLERRALSPTRIDLGALVHALLKERTLDLAGAQLAVDVSTDPVLADRESLTMALRNLIDNAVKFSRGRAPPMVEICSRIDGDMHVVSVRDNGTGFDMKYHDRIFQIFQRLHRAEDYPGTGVGLAIVHMAASRMGGRVWGRSEPDKGAVFYLALPRVAAQAAAEHQVNPD